MQLHDQEVGRVTANQHVILNGRIKVTGAPYFQGVSIKVARKPDTGASRIEDKSVTVYARTHYRNGIKSS